METMTNGANQEPGKVRSAIEYRATAGFSEALHQMGATLFFSTYDRGLLGSVWAETNDRLGVLFSQLPRPMGMAVSQKRLAISTGSEVAVFAPSQNLVLKGQDTPFDIVFTPRYSFKTGFIDAYDIAWATDEELLVVNTAFSNISAMDRDYNFRSIWHPPFIEETNRLDMCHLNGFALRNGVVEFATAFGETLSRADWLSGKVDGGILIDAVSNRVALRGLSMPHSPRFYGDTILFLNAGRGELCRFIGSEDFEIVAGGLPGFAQGMSIVGDYAFVCVSKARGTAYFGDLPITSGEAELRSGICLVDLRNGKIIAFFELISGVVELIDVVPIPVRRAAVLGTNMQVDSHGVVWITPEKAYVF